MMMGLLLAKGKIKQFYEKNYQVVKPFLKLIISFVIFQSINAQIGFSENLRSIWMSGILALICALAPEQLIVYLAAFLAASQVGSISPVLGAALLMLLLAVYLLFGRFAKAQCFIILAIPLMTIFHVSYAVPIVVGLFYGPVILPAILTGVLFRYMFMGIRELFLAPPGTVDLEDSFGAFNYVVEYVFANKELVLFMIVFALTYLTTYLIRKRRVSYASQIGILAGTIIMLVTLLIGNIIFEADIDVILVLIGIGISMILAYIIQFFRMTLDYTGTKSIQFEDEEYYYYVKAVPKLSVTGKDKNVTLITPKQDVGDMSSLQREFDKVFEEEKNNRD